MKENSFWCVLLASLNFLIVGIRSQEDDYSLFPYLNRSWVYMLDENNQPVKAYFTLPPQSRSNVGGEGVDFTLYTRNEPEGIPIEKPEILKDTSFDPKKPTKFITHGWLSSGTSDTCITIKNGYLKSSDVNVIIMNWNNIASNYFYLTPMLSVPEITDHYAEFINGMIEEQDMNPKDIHLIGHSLGAQISGLVGKRLNGKRLGRVTGLDPAFPGFDHVILHRDRISKESAEFVDVIHSCGGFLGVMDPVGHADFYPNGGTMPQPGCDAISKILEACSHGRSWKYFADSLDHPEKPFYAVKCNDWQDFEKEKCDRGEEILMGESTPTTARGKFYLRTASDQPFSLGNILSNYL